MPMLNVFRRDASDPSLLGLGASLHPADLDGSSPRRFSIDPQWNLSTSRPRTWEPTGIRS